MYLSISDFMFIKLRISEFEVGRYLTDKVCLKDQTVEKEGFALCQKT